MHMQRTPRCLGAGLSAVAAAAVLAGLGAPAYAAEDLDLSIEVDAGPVVIEEPATPFLIKASNLAGPTAQGFTVVIDLQYLSTNLVEVTVDSEACEQGEQWILCLFDNPLAVGETYDLPFMVRPLVSKPTSAGRIKVSVLPRFGQQETDGLNNTTTVMVELVSAGGRVGA